MDIDGTKGELVRGAPHAVSYIYMHTQMQIQHKYKTTS